MSKNLDKPEDRSVAKLRSDLDQWHADKRRRYGRFTLAALSSIPWVGGFLSASASLQAEADQRQVNDLQRKWLEEHHRKIQKLGVTLTDIVNRLEGIGGDVDERIEDPAYLQIVRQGFRIWDESATDEKRNIVKNVLQNAGATKICSDDVIRLFLDWIFLYHEVHFSVIKEIYKTPGISRREIWQNIYGDLVPEDSAEADLYRLLIRDLSTGGVIRQQRETAPDGSFLKKKSKSRASKVMKSAFDHREPYGLTELGRQFVHYAMEELVPRIAGET